MGRDEALRGPDDPPKGFFQRSRHLLDALEADEPVVVRGHDLGGRDIPKVPLTEEQMQWPHWYTVHPDDTITPAESPWVDPIRRL